MFISKNFSFSKRGAWPLGSALSVGGANFTGARALLQRFAGVFNRRQTAGGALEHLATLPLSPQPSLVLVRLGQQTLLLGATAHNISLLASSPADSPEGTPLVDETSQPQESRQ
jgi:flagellar biogenesis protein FliO